MSNVVVLYIFSILALVPFSLVQSAPSPKPWYYIDGFYDWPVTFWYY